MTATNPITGDEIKTKIPTPDYLDGWERIFGDKKEEEKEEIRIDNPYC